MKNQTNYIVLSMLGVFWGLMAAPAPGSVVTVGGRAVREAVEYSLKRAPSKAMGRLLNESPEAVGKVISRYGDDGIHVVDRFGGPAMKVLLENPDDVGRSAMRMMTKHGDEAVKMAQNPAGLRIMVKESDEMFKAMAKTRHQAYPVLAQHGELGAKALNNLTPARQRELIRLHQERRFSEADFDKLLKVVGNYGNKGMDFIWRNKGALVVAGGLTAFVANPEPFIEGIRKLGEGFVREFIRTLGEVAGKAMDRVNMNVVVGALIGLFGLRMAIRGWWRNRRTNQQAMATNNQGAC
ncbi:MAG TPA: hypothetical protein PKE26_05140 [Kiritimatiellia bacterium]|nr:hypothetical protein [Kiritimatiellia bacterium]HMO98477.1 hypothetical protein [Kiritimatiellia bacterium]HMP98048.1 hypothetical protein [Kiritimatiellia bacterium]